MTTSRQDVAEDALLALLVADLTLGPVEGGPEWGVPTLPATEHVWIHEAVELEQTPDLTGGSLPEMKETFAIKVGIFVSRSGDDRKAARDRSTVLVAALENLIRANVHLGLPQTDVWFAHVSAIDRSAGVWPDNVGVMKLVTIDVTAFLPGAP